MTTARFALNIAVACFVLALPSCGMPAPVRPPDWTPEPGPTARATVISVTAKKWAYAPSTITLKKGVPVIFEVTSEDVHHGFNLSAFGARADALPGRVARVSVTPDKTGTFVFHCDFFCGEGHEDMQGTIVVVD
jgi:cytochrome c oxidase subunit 2